jgi:hypothetical protein
MLILPPRPPPTISQSRPTITVVSTRRSSSPEVEVDADVEDDGGRL